MATESPSSPRWRTEWWPRTVATIWVIACLAIAVEAYLKPRGHTLFDIYANGIRAWWAGADLYARQPDTNELYRYSPAFAVVTGPLALLPPGAGNAAWKLSNAAVFALGLFVWCRRGAPWAPSADRTATVFLFALLQAGGNLYNGQANLMMTGFLLLGLTAVVRDRWWWAAGLLAAATLMKVFPLALALVFAVLFWRTFPARYLAALGVGLVAPLVAQRPDYAMGQLAEWGRHLVSSTEINRERLRSLDKLFEIFGTPVGPAVFAALAAGAGLLVLAVGVWETRRGSPKGVLVFRVSAWFVTWVVLFSPSSENATFSILSPFVAWALADAVTRPRTWAGRVWLFAALYLMGMATTDAGGPFRHFFQSHCATTFGGLMFQAWLFADLMRQRVIAPPSAEDAFVPVRRAA